MRALSLAMVAAGCLAAHSAAAAIYHVAPGGADNADGGKAAPFKTLARAVKAARPGDTVRVAPGVYTETLAPQVSGQPDKPIIFEGEKSADGQWLSVIDGSVPWQADWHPAPEVGQGVFKATFSGFAPRALLCDGKFVPRIWPNNMDKGEGFRRLAYPDSHTIKLRPDLPDLHYWDTVGAMFGLKDSVVYLRFRGGDDPKGKNLRAAPDGGGVDINDQSHIVIRRLLIRGGESCVLIRGPKASNNLVEDCRMENASQRVYITNGASRTVIRGNVMTFVPYSDNCRTGAWGWGGAPDKTPYDMLVKQHFYREYKYFFGPSVTSDYAVRIYRAGPGNEICGNTLFTGGQGVCVYDARDVDVHHNTISGFSSIGMACTLDKTVNIRFRDNFVSDCNINFRAHHVNQPGQKEPRSLYVYRNRFHLPPQSGSHVYFHYYEKNDVNDYLHPDLFFYHNSFCGGSNGFAPSGLMENCGWAPRTVFLNNVFSTRVGLAASIKTIAAPGALRAVDANWIGGGPKTSDPRHDFTKAPWYSPGNIHTPNGRMWAEGPIPDFRLPPDSPARGAGLDLSRPFKAGGHDFDPLPGMEPGYFKGPRPHIGAVQD